MSLSFKQGLRFDGIRSYVDLGTPTLSTTDMHIKITFMLTAYDPSARTVLIGRRNGASGWNIAISGFSDGGGVGILQFLEAGTSIVQSISGIISLNTLYKLEVYTTNTNIQMYLNGTLVASGSGTWSANNTFALKVGGFQASNAYWMKGEMYYLFIESGSYKSEYLFDSVQDTTLVDISGNSNHGKIYQATWTLKNNPIGFRFNGGGDYINCGSAKSLDFTSTLTMESVIYATSNTKGGLISKSGRYAVFLNSGQINAYDWVTGASALWSNRTNLNDGFKHTITVTIDSGVANGSALYIDGVLDKNFTYNIKTTFSPTLILGAEGINNFNPFIGTMISARIYNCILSASEVVNNVNGNITQNGLVGEWLFKDNGSQQILDTSPSGNHGTIISALSTQIVKKQGLQFNGFSDYVDFGKILVPSTLNWSIVVSFMIQQLPPSGIEYPIWSEDDNNTYKRHVLTYTTSGSLAYRFYDNAGTSYDSIITTGNLPAVKVPYTITLTCNNGVLSAYVNGVSTTVSISNISTLTPNNGSTFKFGRRRTSYSPSTLYYARIYNRALSATEVSDNYIGNLTRLDLIGEWIFKDNGSGKVIDTSGNNNHGTIYGAVYTQKTTKSGLLFNGATDYVTLPTGMNLLGDCSYELTFKCNGSTGFHQCLIDLIDNGNYGYAIFIGSSGKLNVRFSSYTSATPAVVDVGPSLLDGNIHTVKVVNSQFGNNFTIYLDGVVIGSPLNYIAGSSVNKNTYLGARLTGGVTTQLQLPFNGILYFAKIISNGTAIGQYQMAYDVSGLLKDTSGSDNHGTITGAKFLNLKTALR